PASAGTPGYICASHPRVHRLCQTPPTPTLSISVVAPFGTATSVAPGGTASAASSVSADGAIASTVRPAWAAPASPSGPESALAPVPPVPASPDAPPLLPAAQSPRTGPSNRHRPRCPPTGGLCPPPKRPSPLWRRPRAPTPVPSPRPPPNHGQALWERHHQFLGGRVESGRSVLPDPARRRDHELGGCEGDERRKLGVVHQQLFPPTRCDADHLVETRQRSPEPGVLHHALHSLGPNPGERAEHNWRRPVEIDRSGAIDSEEREQRGVGTQHRAHLRSVLIGAMRDEGVDVGGRDASGSYRGSENPHRRRVHVQSRRGVIETPLAGRGAAQIDGG